MRQRLEGVMQITIRTIPHKEQRYDTCGDWLFDTGGNLEIRVSEVGDWRMEALVAFHELAEMLICKRNGVTQAAVDAFDIRYESNRPADDDSEPGDDPAAPYYTAHQFATCVERLLCRELGLNWQDYERQLNLL
jgi:hypothetical protein